MFEQNTEGINLRRWGGAGCKSVGRSRHALDFPPSCRLAVAFRVSCLCHLSLPPLHLQHVLCALHLALSIVHAQANEEKSVLRLMARLPPSTERSLRVPMARWPRGARTAAVCGVAVRRRAGEGPCRVRAARSVLHPVWRHGVPVAQSGKLSVSAATAYSPRSAPPTPLSHGLDRPISLSPKPS